MSSNIELVQPQFIDGIEFYVSKDGSQIGISQSGVARLCGVGENSLRPLLASLSVRDKVGVETLKDILPEDLYLAISSNHQAKVIPAKTAARIIEYYAFESKASNETALFSLRKFATTGIETWVKNITNHDINTDKPVLDVLQQILTEISDLKLIATETETYRKVKVEYAGLNLLLKKYEENEKSLESTCPVLPESLEMFTVAEIVKINFPFLIVKRGDILAIGRTCVSLFKLLAQERPQTKATMSARGYRGGRTTCYARSEFWIVNQAICDRIDEMSKEAKKRY